MTIRLAGEPLAFHFGDRKYQNLDALLQLLEPFSIVKVYADTNLLTVLAFIPNISKQVNVTLKKLNVNTFHFAPGVLGWLEKASAFLKNITCTASLFLNHQLRALSKFDENDAKRANESGVL